MDKRYCLLIWLLITHVNVPSNTNKLYCFLFISYSIDTIITYHTSNLLTKCSFYCILIFEILILFISNFFEVYIYIYIYMSTLVVSKTQKIQRWYFESFWFKLLLFLPFLLLCLLLTVPYCTQLSLLHRPSPSSGMFRVDSCFFNAYFLLPSLL